jgi:hypothetical protein
MTIMCAIANCNRKSEINFSLIRVCKPHFAELYEESLKYYNGDIFHRSMWESIRHYKMPTEAEVYGMDCRGGKCEV